MPQKVVYIQNQFVQEKGAALGVTDLSVQRGYGIFDFLKTLNGVPVFLQNHLDRFQQSAQQMRLALPSNEVLTNLIHELIQRNAMADSGIRMTLTGGYSKDGYQVESPNLIISQSPLQLPDEAAFEKGFSLALYEHQRQLATVKTIDYLMAIWLQPWLKEQGATELLYHHKNELRECPRANIFIVTKEGILKTPQHYILKGITRSKVLELADNAEEGVITLTDLENAAEVFITSTTKRLIPVVTINGKKVQDGRPGPITRKLYQLYKNLESEQVTTSAVHA